MTDDLHLRPASPVDAEWIAARQVDMALETEDLKLDPAETLAGVKHILSHPETGWYLLAEANGRSVACLMVLKEWSDWRNGEVWWIHSVFVLPAFRGRGVYRAMYGYLKNMVEASERVWGLRLYVDKRNQGASAAYEALGMDASHYTLFEWLR